MSGWAIYSVELRHDIQAWEVRASAEELRVIVVFSTRTVFDSLPAKPERLAAAAHIVAGGRGTLAGDWRIGALAIIERIVLRELEYQTRARDFGGLELLEKMLPVNGLRGLA